MDLRLLYKKFVRYSFWNTLIITSEDIFKWYFKKYGEFPTIYFQSKKGTFRTRRGITAVAKFYNKKVMLEAIKYPGKTHIKYIGKAEIIEVNPVNGKPRIVIDPITGKYEEVIQDHFTKSVKYSYLFSIMYNNIKGHLKSYISTAIYPRIKSDYLPIVYELKPLGNFYRKKY